MNFFIVAVDEKWGIAKDHKIPWHFKEDFKFFKEKTKGMDCVLGYNTYKEIAEMRGYPDKTSELLPGRTCHVLTTHDIPINDNVKSISNIEELSLSSRAMAYLGGKTIYDIAMRNHFGGVGYGYITRIKHDYECNILFNNTLLEEYFELIEIINETEDLRFEKWARKDIDAWINKGYHEIN